MINPIEGNSPHGYVYPPYYYQNYAYQRWVDNHKRRRYAGRLQPFRMAVLIQMIVQYILIWEIAVLAIPIQDLRFRIYSMGMLTGIQLLPIGGFLLMLITFFRVDGILVLLQGKKISGKYNKRYYRIFYLSICGNIPCGFVNNIANRFSSSLSELN